MNPSYRLHTLDHPSIAPEQTCLDPESCVHSGTLPSDTPTPKRHRARSGRLQLHLLQAQLWAVLRRRAGKCEGLVEDGEQVRQLGDGGKGDVLLRFE